MDFANGGEDPCRRVVAVGGPLWDSLREGDGESSTVISITAVVVPRGGERGRGAPATPRFEVPATWPGGVVVVVRGGRGSPPPRVREGVVEDDASALLDFGGDDLLTAVPTAWVVG